ncbi:MAG: hypothetical protein MUC50_12695, partial [Myxococcota bacterium]|nr:hypothetical protein [Myxococcota bacterium]
MTVDEIVKKLQSEDVTWDDVRERRVLNRIREELERPAARVHRISPKAWATTGAVAALALIGSVVVLGYRASPGPKLTSAPSVSVQESMAAVEPSVIVIG